jgi:hypothetical protein
MNSYSAKIFKIGINPYVLIPSKILRQIFIQAEKNKGPIPVSGTVDGHTFIQTLIKYSGKWRLYLNTRMRKACGKDVGDMVLIEINFDDKERTTPVHPQMEVALNKNAAAKNVFMNLPPSRQKEILRYINLLKTDESVKKNIDKAIQFLNGNQRFIGRDKP